MLLQVPDRLRRSPDRRAIRCWQQLAPSEPHQQHASQANEDVLELRAEFALTRGIASCRRIADSNESGEQVKPCSRSQGVMLANAARLALCVELRLPPPAQATMPVSGASWTFTPRSLLRCRVTNRSGVG